MSEDFFSRYKDDVLGICYFYLRDRSLSQDLMMDTFEIFIKKKEDTDIANTKAYLLTIARNLCLGHLRKVKKTDLIEDFSLIDVENDEEETLFSDGRLEGVLKAMAQLTTEQRKCIEHFYLHNMSYKEIQSTLHLSYKEVKSHLQNGKIKIRKLTSEWR